MMWFSLCIVGASLFLGHDHETRKQIYIPSESLRTHLHMIGGTGKGKTTLIEAMLHQLFSASERAAHFIFDRLGGLSQSLLMWVSSPYCPKFVRDRFIYIDAAREDFLLTFNPLLYDTLAHGYFKVGRACDCILRAWASQNIEEMPRLARWIFNAMWAAAQLGLTVADCAHLVMPGSPYHLPILRCLPPLLRAEWQEIMQARGGEAGRILESSRNRLKPFFENPILRCIFGSSQNRLDMLRFMCEGRIVLINLAPQNRLSAQSADAIGGMILNELLATARSLPMGVRYPSYVWLDEFQRYVGPDIEEAIPEVRQLGVRLMLSHQSFSQLVKGDTDLTSLIWQPQSRMIFGVQGEDADLLGHEIASLTYDAKKVKDEVYSRRQLLKEQQIILLESFSEAESNAESWQKTYGTNWTAQSSQSTSRGWSATNGVSDAIARRPGVPNDLRTSSRNRSNGLNGNESETAGSSEGGSTSDAHGGSRTTTRSRSSGESILPVYDEFFELSRRSYYTFEEQRSLWAQQVRLLKTGQVLARMVNDPTMYRIDVQRHAPGYLEWDIEKIMRRRPDAVDAVQAFIEQNFASEYFVSPQTIEHETTLRLERILQPTITIHSNPIITSIAVDVDQDDSESVSGNPLA